MSELIDSCATIILGRNKNLLCANDHAKILLEDSVSVIIRGDITCLDIPDNAIMVFLPGNDDPLIIGPKS